MAIDDKTRDEKLQYDINREAAKISALSFGNIDRYEYLTSEGILLSDQSRVIEQAKFTYSPLGKALEKQIKTIEGQGERQIKAIKDNRKQVNNINEYSYKEKLSQSRKRELFTDIYSKILVKISKLSKNINYDDLKIFV